MTTLLKYQSRYFYEVLSYIILLFILFSLDYLINELYCKFFNMNDMIKIFIILLPGGNHSKVCLHLECILFLFVLNKVQFIKASCTKCKNKKLLRAPYTVMATANSAAWWETRE